MEPIVKYYEEQGQLMPKLRPYVTPMRLAVPFQKLMNKKWKKTLNEQGRVKQYNEYLEAFTSTAAGQTVLYYIADMLHKLGLSVAYEMFRLETGYDLFEESLRVQQAEQAPYMCRPGWDETLPQIIYKLADFIVYQEEFRASGDEEAICDYNIVDDIWDELKLWPAFEGHRKPVRKGRAEYDDFLSQITAPIQTSTPIKKRNKYQKIRDYSYEMTCPAPMLYRGEWFFFA